MRTPRGFIFDPVSAAVRNVITTLATKANIGGDNITSAANWRTNLELGPAATYEFGSTAGTIAAGNDARFASLAGSLSDIATSSETVKQALAVVGQEAGLTLINVDGEEWLQDGAGYAFPIADVTAATGNPFGPAYYAWLDDRMYQQSSALLNKPIYGLAPYGDGVNTVLGVGQSLMASADNSARIQLTSTRLLSGLTYSAKMIGDAERCKSSGATYDYFGSLEFNALTETVVSGSTTSATVVDEADVEIGNYTTSARGATPLPAACLTFEYLWRQHNQLDGADTDRFDVAVVVAKGEASLVEISTGDGLSRTLDAILVVEAARAADAPAVTGKRLSCVLERHGQNDEAAGTPAATYQSDHRTYRTNVFNQAATTFGQTLRPPWIGTQVSGYYGQPDRTIANLQLEMSLDKGPDAVDYDYFQATPDYPFPNFADVTLASGHPNFEDGHPTTMAVEMAAAYAAWCRFYVQVLRRNWFMTHMSEAYHSGKFILVGFCAMQPPLRIQEVVTSLTMRMIDAYGFDVSDGGTSIDIVNVTQVGDLCFLIECDTELTAPIVGVAKGERSTWPTYYGASNIVDSQTLWTLFEIVFEAGYTNFYAGQFEDTNDIENIAALLGTQDMGNWAASQTLASTAAPAI